MRHQGRRAQGEVIDFIEQQLGWEVVETRVEEDDGFRDDPPVLELEIRAELELEEENDFRYDSDAAGATQ